VKIITVHNFFKAKPAHLIMLSIQD